MQPQEVVFDIDAYLASTAYQGHMGRYIDEMRKAKTFQAWSVIVDRMIDDSRLPSDNPQALREVIVRIFRKDCPHGQLKRRFRVERTVYQPKFVVSLGDTLNPDVRQKLLALMSSTAT